MGKIINLIDTELFESPKYYNDRCLLHLVYGYWNCRARCFRIEDYYPFLYNAVISVVEEHSEKPITYRRVITRTWIQELGVVISKCKDVLLVNKDMDVVIYTPVGEQNLADLISFYEFEVKTLQECLDANFEGIEYEQTPIKINAVFEAEEVEEEEGVVFDIRNEDGTPCYYYPFIDLHRLFYNIIELYDLDERLSEKNLPVEDIVNCELKRRGLWYCDYVDEHSVDEYKQLIMDEEVMDAIDSKARNGLVTYSDKQRAAVLYYMLHDALFKQDKLDLLVKAISFVNHKEFDQTKKSNSSAYSYVHNIEKLDSQKSFVVAQLKRYGLENLLKNYLNSAELRQYGIE